MSAERSARRGRVTLIPRRSGSSLGLSGKLVVFMFTVVPMSGIAVAALGGLFADFRVASFSGTALVGAFAGLASWTLVSLYRRVPTAAARIVTVFAAFGVVVVGSALLGVITRQGTQFIQVLVAALGALLLAAAARRSQGDILDATISRCVRLTSVLLLGAALGSAAGLNINVSPRTSAIVALIGMGWFLAEHRVGRRYALIWALALLAAIAISLSRTALFAGFVILALTLIAGSPRRRLRGVVLAVLLLTAGYAAMTSWAPLHDRFSQGDVSLSVGGFRVNAEGRTYVWSTLWSEVPDNALLGHGPGAASACAVELDPSFDHPHNDYLRLIYDFGVVGCALFAWGAVRIASGLRRAKSNGVPTLAAGAALTAGLAILIVMITDNPLDYPFVMIPLGALIGVGLGSTVPRARALRTTTPATTGLGADSGGAASPCSREIRLENGAVRRRFPTPVGDQAEALACNAALLGSPRPGQVRDPVCVGESHVPVDEVVRAVALPKLSGDDWIQARDRCVLPAPTRRGHASDFRLVVVG